jgi:hypothetical protein
MPLLQNLLGRQFGDLTVWERAPENSRYNHVRWICSCACGGKAKTIVAACSLTSGRTRSCGCLRRRLAGARSFKDCIGQRFGWLVVLERAGSKSGRAMWLCLCDCGNKVVVSRNDLARGHTKSCGCLRREKNKTNKAGLTHGMSKTREYRAYQAAKARCTNPNHQAYADYGGRGIEFRLPDFVSFFAKLGLCPPGRSLDRIENDGHYEFGNIHWATRSEQERNKRKRRKRNNRLLIAPRPTQTAAEWATEFNVPLDAVQALQARIRASQGAAP